MTGSGVSKPGCGGGLAADAGEATEAATLSASGCLNVSGSLSEAMSVSVLRLRSVSGKVLDESVISSNK
jgi:hypothetical protein